MTKTVKLYAQAYQDRSDRVRWLLEELKVPYENIWLKKKNGDLTAPAYLELNPQGRTPTLVDGDIILFESTALCLYIADAYGYGSLAPRTEDKKIRAEYMQWMTWSTGSLECVIARMFTHVSTPEETLVTKTYVKEQCEIFKKLLVPILSKQDYILSSGFSAADIMLAAIIPGAHDYLVEGVKPLEDYMNRLKNREAAVRAKVFE
ncbi:MAG: glutathione S-transferase family protein [Proteobacteria bacterium]|nr:MAG: glutathione S-transferase family protein [Pseudomonadota bacterium]